MIHSAFMLENVCGVDEQDIKNESYLGKFLDMNIGMDVVGSSGREQSPTAFPCSVLIR